jgi:hypothetical protein
MPRALLLPDNRVRLFVNGSHDGQDGIFSLISDDGLSFIAESGMRISAPAGFIINDAQPVRLAASADALNWTADPRVIGYGGTSCMVETGDGTLFIYYVNR